MKKITVEITYDDPNDPDAFHDSLDARSIWRALPDGFPDTDLNCWTVQQIESSGHYWKIGKPIGGMK